MDKQTNQQHFDFSSYEQAEIGVLSDTHSFIDPSIIKHLVGCDLVLHAGDIGSMSVLNQLNQITNEVISVCGNNDTTGQWDIAEHEELNKIPLTAEISLPGGIISITHGDEFFSDYDDWHAKLRATYPSSKAIIYGHSHRLVCDQDQEPWVLNPGAAGATRVQKHGVSCLRIQTSIASWNVQEFRT